MIQVVNILQVENVFAMRMKISSDCTTISLNSLMLNAAVENAQKLAYSRFISWFDFAITQIGRASCRERV